MARSVKEVVVDGGDAPSAVTAADDDSIDDWVDDADEDVATTFWGPSRRLRITALVLSLLGLADSTYLTIAHFEANLLSVTCAANSVINCQKVTTSPQSVIFHIPVAILGLAFYVAMTVINLPPLWRTTDVRVAWLRLAMVRERHRFRALPGLLPSSFSSRPSVSTAPVSTSSPWPCSS